MPRKKIFKAEGKKRPDCAMLFDYLHNELLSPPPQFKELHLDLSKYESFDISKRTIYERALIGTDMVLSVLYRSIMLNRSYSSRSGKPRKETVARLTYIYHELRFRTWLSTQIDYLKELEAVEFVKQKDKEESKPIKRGPGRPRKKPIEPSPLSAEMERMVERMVEKYKSQPFNQEVIKEQVSQVPKKRGRPKKVVLKQTDIEQNKEEQTT